MDFPIELILLPIGVVFLNVMDAVTTRIALNQVGDKECKAEGNPVMRWLMLKNRIAAEVIKQVVVLGVIACCLIYRDSVMLVQLSVLFGFIVVNNSYVVVAQAITRRQQDSPLEMLRRLLHVPRKFRYLVALSVLASLMWITYEVIK